MKERKKEESQKEKQRKVIKVDPKNGYSFGEKGERDCGLMRNNAMKN